MSTRKTFVLDTNVLNLNPSPLPVLGLAALFLLIHRVSPTAIGEAL